MITAITELTQDTFSNITKAIFSMVPFVALIYAIPSPSTIFTKFFVLLAKACVCVDILSIGINIVVFLLALSLYFKDFIKEKINDRKLANN